MAAKSISNIRGETKNIRINVSSEVPAVVALSSVDKKFALAEDQDSFHYEKGLQLSDEELNEMKFEISALNKADNLGNESSSAVGILKKTKTMASTPTNITVKQEIISTEEESILNVPYTPTPIKPAKAQDELAGEVNLKTATSGNQVPSDENKKECNKIIRLAPKNLSDEERKILRAKRFNIIVADSNLNSKKDVAKEPATLVCKNTSSSTNHPETPTYDTLKKRAERFGENVSTVMKSTPTYDTLKKRAARFGENVSTVMKSLNYKEKMLKRKLKFLESVTNLKEIEIKKMRAERFRMV